MARRSQCSSAGDNPLDPNYLPPHYREEYRLAIDALVEDDLDGYYNFLQKADVVDFLAVPEIEHIQNTVKFPQQHSHHPEQHFMISGGDGSSDTYWPLHSDIDAPILDLGWPQIHRFIGPTEITTLVNPPEADMPSIKEQARRLIKNAQQVIALVMDMFTDVDIFADILDAATRNVAVYVLLDEQNVHHFVNMLLNCRVNLEIIQFLRVRTVSGITYHCCTGKSFKGQMMDRFLFTDCRAVLSGNYSFMWSFEKLHRCMAHLFLGQIVSTFDEEFRILYAQSEPLDVEKVLAAMEELNQVQKKEQTMARPSVYRETEKFPAMDVPHPEDLRQGPYNVGIGMDWKKMPLSRHESIHRKPDWTEVPQDMYKRYPPQQSRMEQPYDQGQSWPPELEDPPVRRHSFVESALGRLPSHQFLQQQGRQDFDNQGRQVRRGQPPYAGAAPEPDYSSYDQFWNQYNTGGEQFTEPNLPIKREPPSNFDPVLHYLSSTAMADFDQGSGKFLPAGEAPFSTSHSKRKTIGKPYASQSPTPSSQSDQKQSLQEPSSDRKDPVVKRGLRNWRISSYLSAFDNAEDEGLPLPASEEPDAFDEPPNPTLQTAPVLEVPAPIIPIGREHKLPTLPWAGLTPMYGKFTTRESSKNTAEDVEVETKPSTTPPVVESPLTTEDNKAEEKESRELKSTALRRNYNTTLQRSSRLRSSLIFSSQLDQQDAKTATGQQEEEDVKADSEQAKLPFASQVLNQRRPFEWSRYKKSASFDIQNTETSKPEDMSGTAKEKEATKEKKVEQSATFDNSSTETSKSDDSTSKAAKKDLTKEQPPKESASADKAVPQPSKPDHVSDNTAEKRSKQENTLKQLDSSSKLAAQTSKQVNKDGKADDKSSTGNVSKEPEKRDIPRPVKPADADQSLFTPMIPPRRLSQMELPKLEHPVPMTSPLVSNPAFLDMSDPDQRLMFFKELAAKRKAAKTTTERPKNQPVVVPSSHSEDRAAVKSTVPVPEKSALTKKALMTLSEGLSAKKAVPKDASETESSKVQGSIGRTGDVTLKGNTQLDTTRTLQDSDKTGAKDHKSCTSLPADEEVSSPQTQQPAEVTRPSLAQTESSPSVPHLKTDAPVSQFSSLLDLQRKGTATNENQTTDPTSQHSSNVAQGPSESLSRRESTFKIEGGENSFKVQRSATQGGEGCGKHADESSRDTRTATSVKTEQRAVLPTSNQEEVKNYQTGESVSVSVEATSPSSHLAQRPLLTGPAIEDCIISIPAPPNPPSPVDLSLQGSAEIQTETLDESGRQSDTSSETLSGDKTTTRQANQTVSTESQEAVATPVEVDGSAHTQESHFREQPRAPAEPDKAKMKTSEEGKAVPGAAETQSSLLEQTKLVMDCIINIPPVLPDASSSDLPVGSPQHTVAEIKSKTEDNFSQDSGRLSVTSSETLLEKEETIKHAEKVSQDSKSVPTTSKRSEEQQELVRASTSAEVKKDQAGAQTLDSTSKLTGSLDFSSSGTPIVENASAHLAEQTTSTEAHPPAPASDLTQEQGEQTTEPTHSLEEEERTSVAAADHSQSRPHPGPCSPAAHSTPVQTMSPSAKQEHSSSGPSSDALGPTANSTEQQESVSHPSPHSNHLAKSTTAQEAEPPVQTASDSAQGNAGSFPRSTPRETSADSAHLECKISTDSYADGSEGNAASTSSTIKTDSGDSCTLKKSLSELAGAGGEPVSSSVAHVSPPAVEAESCASAPSVELSDRNAAVPPEVQMDHGTTQTNVDSDSNITPEPLIPPACPSDAPVLPHVAQTEVIPPSDENSSCSTVTIPPVADSRSCPESKMSAVLSQEKTEGAASTKNSSLETSLPELSPSDKSADESQTTHSTDSDLTDTTSNSLQDPTEPNLPGGAPGEVLPEGRAQEPTTSADKAGVENHCLTSKDNSGEENPEDLASRHNEDNCPEEEFVSLEKPTSDQVTPAPPQPKQPKTTPPRQNSTASVLSSSNLRDDTKLLLGQISANSQSRHDAAKESAATDDEKGDDKKARRVTDNRGRGIRGQTMNTEEREKLLEKIQSIRKENKVYSRFQMAP